MKDWMWFFFLSWFDFPCTCRHIITACGAASHFSDQFQQSVHSSVWTTALWPGHSTTVHPAAPERQHEDVHALQNWHGQSGGSFMMLWSMHTSSCLKQENPHQKSWCCSTLHTCMNTKCYFYSPTAKDQMYALAILFMWDWVSYSLQQGECTDPVFGSAYHMVTQGASMVTENELIFG